MYVRMHVCAYRCMHAASMHVSIPTGVYVRRRKRLDECSLDWAFWKPCTVIDGYACNICHHMWHMQTAGLLYTDCIDPMQRGIK